jgi:hypothetical protein
MVYPLSERAPGASNLTAKNRVWGFFENSNRTRPANRRKPSELRRKIRPTPTKTASGIPYWPSRDPIQERGGVNLYGFCYNDSYGWYDFLGREPKPNGDLESKPNNGFNPDLGNYNKEKHDKNGKGNCASLPFGENKAMAPDPKLIKEKGCKMVTKDTKCEKPMPNRVIWTGRLDETGRVKPNSAHVIGQECGKATYEQQLGIGGPIFDGITDPNKAVNAYMEELKKKGHDVDGKEATIHFCCPCKEVSNE